MKLVYPYAAALDIGKKKTVARIHTPRHQQTRTFSMMTRDLLEMADWLREHRVTHVAMEATGAYWKPVFNVLEGYDLELLLAGPHDFKAVPGRKIDVKDAEWLADLLRHGLLRPSFVPNREHRELRELVRYRRKLIEERTREYNRLEKVLEGANIKITTVASKITGKSVRRMLWAIIKGVVLNKRVNGGRKAGRSFLDWHCCRSCSLLFQTKLPVSPVPVMAGPLGRTLRTSRLGRLAAPGCAPGPVGLPRRGHTAFARGPVLLRRIAGDRGLSPMQRYGRLPFGVEGV